MKRGVVLSSGAAKGAYAIGILDYLIKEKQYSWDVSVGTSTGALIAPLIVLNRIDKLKDAYLNINSDNIFSINPFNNKGKIRLLNAVYRILTKKSSFGVGHKLQKFIERTFTHIDYMQSKYDLKKIYLYSTNYTTGKKECICQKDVDYETFCKFMYASSSVPIAFEGVKITHRNLDGFYLDGGVMEPLGIQRAVEAGCDVIDIIILDPKTDDEKWYGTTTYEIFERTLELMQKELMDDDILIGKLYGTQKHVTLNFYYTPYKLTNNSLIFNKEEMNKWYQDGYIYAKEHGPAKVLNLIATAPTEEIFKYKKA